MITSNGIVIDGYARLEAARLQGRPTVECVEYEIFSRRSAPPPFTLSSTIFGIAAL